MRTTMPSSPSGSGVGEVFQLFRDGRGRTKSELAVLTGLSRNTVAARIDALIATGLLAPDGSEPSSGGRPPARVAFNELAGVVLAIDLGATHGTIAVTTLSARVLDARSMPLDIGDGPEAVFDSVFAVARELLGLVAEGTPLLGVGVGLPGPVEHSTGRPINPPIMPGWDGFDVPEYVRRSFPGPVLVDNDVNILALGEHALSWPDVDDLIFVKVATGLGAGIIAEGRLLRGAQGVAGDIGYIQVPFSRDSPHPVGDDRTLALLASGTAIAGQLAEQGVAAATSRDVVRLIHAGDQAAIQATRQAGREVGEVLAGIVNTLNPSVIVVGGSIARAGEYLLAGIKETVFRRSVPLATQHLQIAPSRGGDRAGVLGAAILVTQHVLSAANVDSLVLNVAP